jgi:ribose transport system ATP-binding protein
VKSWPMVVGHPRTEPVLRVSGLTKSFGGVMVVDHVSFTIWPGEVVGLVGQNGSGKSTILKMLARFYRPDEGSFVAREGRSSGEGPSRLLHHNPSGIAFVHQDLGLVPSLSVVENLALGRGYPHHLRVLIDWRQAEAEARAILHQHGIPAEPGTLVEDLSLADRALLAIGRALGVAGATQTPLLVLDEPTASLPDAEVGRVLAAVGDVARRGGAVIFVSHRLDEVLQVASRVLVIRDGRLVADEPRRGLSHDRLLALMLGREFRRIVALPQSEPLGKVARLQIRGLSGRLLRNFSCSVAAGEILGVTGLLGSGKSELGRILAGAQVASAGWVAIDGQPVALRRPRDAVRVGIGYVPPDRRTQGGLSSMTATENLTLPDLRSFLRPLFHLLDHRAEEAATLDWMRRAGVVPRIPRRRFDTFSGGNQQKLVYGRWVRLSPKVLVLDEPTRGVDVGAVADLYQIIREQAAQGTAVLLLSSEWEDLPRVCHRIIVLDRGRAVVELRGKDRTLDSIVAAAYGHVGHRNGGGVTGS